MQLYHCGNGIPTFQEYAMLEVVWKSLSGSIYVRGEFGVWMKQVGRLYQEGLKFVIWP